MLNEIIWETMYSICLVLLWEYKTCSLKGHPCTDTEKCLSSVNEDHSQREVLSY